MQNGRTYKAYSVSSRLTPRLSLPATRVSSPLASSRFSSFQPLFYRVSLVSRLGLVSSRCSRLLLCLVSCLSCLVLSRVSFSWSLGLVVPRSLSPLSSGLLIPWSPWSLRLSVYWSLGLLFSFCLWSLGLLVSWPLSLFGPLYRGLLISLFLGLLVSWFLGILVSWSLVLLPPWSLFCPGLFVFGLLVSWPLVSWSRYLSVSRYRCISVSWPLCLLVSWSFYLLVPWALGLLVSWYLGLLVSGVLPP